jgi:hypothetical protein
MIEPHLDRWDIVHILNKMGEKLSPIGLRYLMRECHRKDDPVPHADLDMRWQQDWWNAFYDASNEIERQRGLENE